MSYTNEIFVTLCVKNTKKQNRSANEQHDMSKGFVQDIVDSLGQCDTLVYELTQKGNVHWHAVIQTPFPYQIVWERLYAHIGSDPVIKKVLHLPEHAAVKDVWDPEWLKGVYLRKAEHNKLGSNKPRVEYVVVSDSDSE